MSTTETLEEKADRLYRFIYDYLMENAQPPTHKEMVEGMRVSRETLSQLLDLLVSQGRAVNRRHRHRQVWLKGE